MSIYHIQPPSDLSLYVGGNYTDQYEQVDETLSIWERDLRRYNLNTYDFISNNRRNPVDCGGGRLLADPVGSGKSPITARLIYALTTRLREMDVKLSDGRLAADLPILLVGDKSAKWQWVEYFRDWVPEWPLYKTLMLDGDCKDVATQLDVAKMIGTQVIILNYDKLRLFEDDLRARGPYLLTVLDEIRRIKNANTQRNQSADAIESIFRVGLDGTPLTKEPNSLHGILSWLMPGPYRSKHESGKWPKMPKVCPLTGWRRDDAKKHGCNVCDYFQHDWLTDYAGQCLKMDKRLEGKPPHEGFYHLYSPTWGDYDAFEERYCLKECSACGARLYEDGWSMRTDQQWRCGHKGWVKIVGAIREEELRNRLVNETMLMSRIKSEDIKHRMPEVTFQWETVEMTHEQSKFYSQAEEGLLEWVSGEGEFQTAHLTNMLAQISYLRSFTTIPPSVVLETMKNGGKMPEWLAGVNIPDNQNSGKTTWTLEFIQDYLNGHDKCIVFSEWSRMTHDLLPRINKILKDGQYAVEIHGGLDEKKRQAAQTAFNDDPLCKVIICTPAGNASINLHKGVHGDGILYIVNVDCSWLPSDLEQRIGRAKRTGFDGAAIIAYFLMSIKENEGGTIDSRMARRVKSRADTIDKLMADNSFGQFFNIKGREDIIDLLTGD